jgi:hypothetical protein
LVEVLIFRFDNLFITIALLCSIGAAYFSVAKKYHNSGSEKSEVKYVADMSIAKWIFIQVWLLLFSLLIYQAAFSAYIVVFTYVLLVNFSKNKQLSQIISEMRHWTYSILFSIGSYIPFAIATNVEKMELQSAFNREMPGSIHDMINNILENICNYFKGLYNDWSVNTIGVIFFALSICFTLTFLVDTWKNIKNRHIAIARITVICICVFAFFLSPLGVSIPLELSSHKIYEIMNPRIVYSIIILMAFILYKNYFFLMQVATENIHAKKYTLYRRMYEGFLFFFGLWSIYYMNCFGNIMYIQQQLQHNVFYDLANDLHDIRQEYQNFSRLYIHGNVCTPVMRNFYSIYPINKRILPEPWHMAIYSFFDYYCYKKNNKPSTLATLPRNNRLKENMTLLKSKPWYSIYSVDCNELYVKLNGIDICGSTCNSIMVFKFDKY